MFSMKEIDLVSEGYTGAEICMLDIPEGLEVETSISGNFVRLTISAICEAANKHDVDVPFSLFVTGTHEEEDGATTSMRDLVTKGFIHIMAGPAVPDEPEGD